jgi:hypothetical protein
MRWSSVRLLCVSQRHGGWNQKSTHQSKRQISTACLCFLAQASLFFLLMSFSSVFCAAIWPWRPNSHSLLWTVDVEMCLLFKNRFLKNLEEQRGLWSNTNIGTHTHALYIHVGLVLLICGNGGVGAWGHTVCCEICECIVMFLKLYKLP